MSARSALFYACFPLFSHAAWSGGPMPVTSEMLLEHVKARGPEVSALREVAWTDHGRRVAISAFVGNHAEIQTIETRTGAASVIGAGYGVVAATRSDVVAYYPAESQEKHVSLARANGKPICTIHDIDLMPDSNGIQTFALTANGSHIVLAIGYGTQMPRRTPPSSGMEGAQVQVFGAAQPSRVTGGVALWIADHRCGNARLVSKIEPYSIGRLAWADAGAQIVALAGRPVAGQRFPRSDLLAVQPHSKASWRILKENVGEQARRLSSVSFLYASPGGRHVAVSYDEEGLPYALRKQLAIVSVEDGSVRVVSEDPRQATGWLDSRTLWVTVVAAHHSLAGAATLGLDGVEHKWAGVPGYAVPSPDGRQLAWMTNDLYGNSSLAIASVDRDRGKPVVREEPIVWRRELPTNKEYARGERRILQCDSSNGVRPAAILVLPLDYREGQQYPLIVDIHGGPQGGLDAEGLPYAVPSVLGFSTLEHDMWAAKGYAVLSADYRASGRYGFDRLSRDGNAYTLDYQDIMCNVDQVVHAGIADPEKMAIIGHSHGGTEVNWIVTQTSRFKAAISKEGSYNVDAMISWGQSGYANQLFTTLYGSPLEHPEHYRRMSMIEAVRNVSTPTMFVEHQKGQKPGDLYRWLYAAWQQRGIKSQLRIYDDESHTLQRPEDQADVLKACIEWIDGLVKGTPQTGKTPSAS